MTETLMDRVLAATGGGRPAPDTRPAALAALAAPREEATPEQADAVQAYLDKHAEKFRAALPECVSYDRFMAAVRAVLPKVAHCTPGSLLQALLTCARFGLVPDEYEAVIDHQGKVAVFIPTYRGYVALMYRSGMVKSVHVGLIHEGDDYHIEPTAPAPDDFKHLPRPELPKAERGPVILTYAFAWLEGGARSQVVYANREKAEEIRDEYSTAYQLAEASGRKDSYWHVRFDDMWRKTALRLLFPLVPTSAEVRRLLAAEDAGHDGQLQGIHAPDAETGALVADAERAHRAAEGNQEVPARPLVKRNAAGRRFLGKKQRGGRKNRGR
ncbi:recombinase RecT [Streptomyces sp. OK228]|uniref:recombinase RecT n=1 Tax=Streptomyces sp. OK228 TaxID=1882786 RepID=UPI000BCE63B9|nr:recombinase RecT [Streptomyces sp. OK228]SOE31693.1 recombinase, phage RecT family [Streptomyces sp. OK228]